MSIYSNGTFRVGAAQTLKNFSFKNINAKSNKIKWYPRARNMWDDQINWELVKQRVENNTKGSQEEAIRIKELLLKIDNAMTSDNKEGLYPEELQMLYDDLASTNLHNADGKGYGVTAQSLLSYNASKAKWKGAVGISFENRMNALIKMIMNTPDADYRTGGAKFRVGSPIEFQMSKMVSKAQLASLQLDKEGKLTKASKDALWAIVKEDTNGDYRKLIGAYQYVIKQQEGIIKDVIIRQVDVDRKIDITIPNIAKIKTKASDTVTQLRKLLNNRTFSLKNYSEWNQNYVHIGEANQFRRMSSFFYFATNSKNFADICTFIFASNNSKDQTVKRYVNWVRLLYELTGTGQLWNSKTGRLVDYIVINIYNKSGPEGLIINSVKSYLDGMPSKDPSIYFNSDYTFRTGQFELT